MDKITLLAYWKDRSITAEEYLEFTRELLKKLTIFDSVFLSFFSWGKSKNAKKNIDNDYSNFESIVFNHIEDHDLRYINPDPSNDNLTKDSRQELGFSNSFTNITSRKNELFNVSVAAGATGIITNSVKIEFPEYSPNSKFYQADYVSKLFKLIISYCDPNFATVISNEFLFKVAPEEDDIPVGWFTYVDKKIESNREVNMSQFHSGTIMNISDKFFFIVNEEIMKEALMLQKYLVKYNVEI